MPSETLSTIFSAKENVTDALENISEATAKAKQTLESAEESVDDLDDSLDNATVSSEAFRSAVSRAENATDELGDEAVATAVEIQALNTSFSTLQTPDFDATGLRRAEDMAIRARRSIENVSDADVSDLRGDFEELADDIENVSRIDLSKRMQKPLTDTVRSLEDARDKWDEFDEGIAEGSVYDLLRNMRDVEKTVSRLDEKSIIESDVDIDNLSAKLQDRLRETEFSPTITSPFFDESKIEEQLSSVESELDEFEDQRLISGEAVEVREIRNRIERIRSTFEDEDIDVEARVESIADDLGALKGEVEAFEETEEVTIETDVESATSIEKFQRLAFAAARLQEDIGDIEAEIDAASVTDVQHRIADIRNELGKTGNSLDNIRNAFRKFEDLSEDVDFDIDEEDFEELREDAGNIGHVSVDPKEVTADMEEAMAHVEKEVDVTPHVEGLEEAKARLRTITEVLEDEDIEVDVAVERVREEMRKAAASINDIQSEVDDIDVDVDIDDSRIEEVRERTEEMDDIKKSISFQYDEDTFERVFQNIRELEERSSDVKKTVTLGYDKNEFNTLFNNLQQLRDEELKKSIDIGYDEDTLDRLFNTLRAIDTKEISPDVDDSLDTRIEMEYDDDMFEPLESIERKTVDVEADTDDAVERLRRLSGMDVDKRVDIGYDDATLTSLFHSLNMLDDMEMSPDVDESFAERMRNVSDIDLKKNISIGYDEDTLSRLFNTLREVDAEEISPDVEPDVDVVEAIAKLRTIEEADIDALVDVGYNEAALSRLFTNLQIIDASTPSPDVEPDIDFSEAIAKMQSIDESEVDVLVDADYNKGALDNLFNNLRDVDGMSPSPKVSPDVDTEDAVQRLRSLSDIDIGKRAEIGYDEDTLTRLSNTLRDIDTKEVTPDINVEGDDARARVEVEYDRDSLEALYTRLREIDGLTVSPEIDEDFRGFVESLDERAQKRVEFVYDRDSLDITPTFDEDAIERLKADITDINTRLREDDGTFTERFEEVSDELEEIQQRVDRLRRSSQVDIISGADNIEEVDTRLRNVNDTFEKNINSGAKANSIYADMRRSMAEISDEDIDIDVDEPDVDAEQHLSLPVVANTAGARTKIEELIQEYSSREIDIEVNTQEVEQNAAAIKNAIRSVEDEEIRFDASSSTFENLLQRSGVQETLDDTFGDTESVDEFKESMTEFNARMGLSKERADSLNVAMNQVGDETIKTALAQDDFGESLYVMEKRAGLAQENMREVERAAQRMGISLTPANAAILATASSLDHLEDEAEEADDALELNNLESLGLGMRSASLNLGALNVGLTQMATTIPAIVTLIGSLAVALGGLASAALLAGGAIAAIFAGGVLFEAENLAATSEDIESTMDAVSKIMENIGELFRDAFEPLKDVGAFNMFRSFVEGAAEALNMLLQGVAEIRGELRSLNASMGDAFWSNFEYLIIEIQDTIIEFMPTLIALTEWLMRKLPQALDFMQSEGLRFMDALAEISTMLVRFFVVLSKLGVTAFNAIFPILSSIIELFDMFINFINSLPEGLVEAIASFVVMMVVMRGLIGVGKNVYSVFSSMSGVFSSVAENAGAFRGGVAAMGGVLSQVVGLGDEYKSWLNDSGRATLANVGITGALSNAYGKLKDKIVTAVLAMKGYIVSAWESYASTLTLSNLWATAKWAVLGFAGAVKAAALSLWGFVTGVGAAVASSITYIGTLAANVISLIGFMATALITEGVLYTLGAAFGVATAAAGLFSLVLDALGIGLIIKAVVLLAVVLGVVAGALAHNEAIVAALKGAWNALAGALITVFNTLMEIGVPIFNFFIEVLELFAAVGEAVVDVLVGIFNTIFGAGAAGNLMSALFNGLSEMLTMLVDMIAGFFEFLGQGIEEITRMINKIPGVDVETDSLEGAKISAEDATIEQGKMLGDEGKSDGKMSPEEQARQQQVENNNITHNNYNMSIDAMPGETARIKRLVKDALDDANRKKRLKQGYSG